MSPSKPTNKVAPFADFNLGSEDWTVVVLDSTSAAIQITAKTRHLVEQIHTRERGATGPLESPELIEVKDRLCGEQEVHFPCHSPSFTLIRQLQWHGRTDA